MTAKYGDRFRPAPTQPSSDTLDVGGPVATSDKERDRDEPELEPQPPQAWYRSRAARAALVLSVVVGAAGGAYGWEQWLVRSTELAAQGAIDLVATSSSLSYPNEREVRIGVRYQNEGAHGLTLTDVRIDDPRLVVVSDVEELEVAAGESAAHIVTVELRCPDSEATPDQPHIVVRAQTVDGRTHDVVLDGGVDQQVLDWQSYACDLETYAPSFADYYADITSVTPGEGEPVVLAVLEFGIEPAAGLQIQGVAVRSGAFAVTTGPVSTGLGPGGPMPRTTVAYRIDDCADAREATDADMALRVTGSLDAGPKDVLVVNPTAPLAIELVRLVERVCVD